MRIVTLAATLLLLAACSRVADGTKDALNKGGEIAGKAASEVLEGVTTGVEETLAVEVSISEGLRTNGISLGSQEVEQDADGRTNRLVVYLVANKTFNDTLSALAFDKDGKEMGRAQLPIQLTAGSADHYVFQFQARTDLARKSKVMIQ
ncbi:MAG: hypothetical protein JNL52_07625 [Flavobacteriales bacterium]|nr:hypothetical protein [Flavobacteriales bacterium]